MKNLAKLLFSVCILCSVLPSCKKEEVKPPPSSGTPRSLTTYETCVSGDWIVKRVDNYDATGTTYSSIDESGYPSSAQTHYNLTGQASAICGSTKWEAWVGTNTSPTQSCWTADTTTGINLASVDYTVELLTVDSMIIRQAASGPGYRLFMKK